MTPRFSLQTILEFRHGIVEHLEVELGQLLTEQRETEQRLATLQEVHNNLLGRLSLAQSGDLDMAAVNWLRANISSVNAYIESALVELARWKREVAEKRAELVEARQSEETLEILKRKRAEAWEAEQLQVEARTQDDIYISRAFQNQHQGV